MSATESSSLSAFDTISRRVAPAPPVQRLGERLAVVRAPRELDEGAARAFARTVLTATDDGVRELVLDLTAVGDHAWAAVYALCELEAHLCEACCDSVAAAGDPVLVQDLRAVGLDHAWSLVGTVDEALSALLARPVA
jgi:anti-anti-sigma regulatory factor